jgi:hypothetical protein
MLGSRSGEARHGPPHARHGLGLLRMAAGRDAHILPIFPIRSEAAAFLGLYLAVDTCVPW